MISNDEMISSLQALAAIESVAVEGTPDKPFGEGPARALDCALALCGALGFRTKRCGSYMGYAEIGEGTELIGILVHLDVVPAGSGWDYPPYAATVADGKLYGRGVTDDKGPAVACIYAMKDLLDSGIPLKKRVRILFGLSEEAGEWPDMEYYKQTEELPSYGFTPDADFPAIYGEKGIAMIRFSMPLGKSGLLEAEGGTAPNMVPDACFAVLCDGDGSRIRIEATGKSAHGSTPEDGENAISKLMADIRAKGLPCPFADFYNEAIGFDLHGEHVNCRLSDEQSGALTLNAGMLRADENTVHLTADIRYPVTCTLDEVTGRLQEAAASYGVTVAVETHRKPVYMDKDSALIRSLMEAYREATGDTQAQPAVMGGGTYARAMDHIVAFGPMLPGRPCTEHQANENLPLEDFFKLREIYGLALKRLCQSRQEAAQ